MTLHNPKQENEYDFYLYTPEKNSFWGISIAHQNEKPCLEIKKRFTNVEDIRRIIETVLKDGHITITATFKDELKATVALREAGLLPEFKD